MQFLNPHGIRFKIVVYTLLCLSLIGVCSNLFLYSYMNSIITEKASAIDSMYLETIRVQLDAKLSEVNDLAVLCASEPELARVMERGALAAPSEKRQALRVQEQLNAYLHSCAQSDYINKLMAFNEHGVVIGIEPTGRFGSITLDGRTDGRFVYLSIRDNGVGIPPETLETLLTASAGHKSKGALNGIGVGNVDQRLKLVYGPECGLSYESAVGEYTKVTVKILREVDADV